MSFRLASIYADSARDEVSEAGSGPAMGQALEGIRVLELAQLAAVPMAGRLLADLGADVIHIEHPARGDVLRIVMAGQGGRMDGPNYVWENYNRNKRSMTLDVSKQDGLEVLWRLVESSDVFLTNMRPFETERYHLQYEALSRRNPRLCRLILSPF